jgi:hypothetical protein
MTVPPNTTGNATVAAIVNAGAADYCRSFGSVRAPDQRPARGEAQ